MKSLTHLYTRIIDTPLAIHPAKFDAILGVLSDRLGLEATAEQIEAAAKPFKAAKQTYELQDGIAVIGISGSLMKKSSGLMAASGSASYETIGAEFQDAVKNPNVKGILLDIDSPGGETSGLFELADMLCSLKGDKPVFAISNDSCFSAAYAIGCCADKLFLTRTAGVGSIGVFCCHVDQSQADAQAGKKFTFIHAGAKKVDGNSHEPLSESALSDTQAEVDRQYQMFVSLVAKNRNVSEDQIKGTEAGVCFGENAIPLLADAVGTFEDAMSALCTQCEVVAALQKVNADLSKYSSAEIKSIYARLAQSLKEEKETHMAKKNEMSIDELVAQAAAAVDAKSTDEYMDDAEDAQDEADDAKDKAKEKQDDADDEADEADDAKENDGEDEDDEDDEDDKKEANKADYVRIVNLCTIAKLPSLAADFINANYTVAQVEKALLKHRASKTKKVKIASSSSKPANDFASVANQILTDDKISPAKKADAYRKHLLAHKAEYLQSMLKRNDGNKSGQNYSFLKQRGY